MALRIDEAARAIGLGRTSFERYVMPHVKVLRRGRVRVVPVSELERWLEENSETFLAEHGLAASKGSGPSADWRF